MAVRSKEEFRRTPSFSYRLIRTKRKTMALKVEEDGSVVVRAPLGAAGAGADFFVESHKEWIDSRRKAYERIRIERLSYTEEERSAGRQRAKAVLEEKCRYFARRMGVDYGRITVREQKTRWGSCSGAGNLSFNWKLALMPEEILDYLVVHELAHRREMNHSQRFWEIVEKEIPDYKKRRDWLRKNGARF